MTPEHEQLKQAVERLTEWSVWTGDNSPDPYRDSGHTMHDDLRLVLARLEELERDKERLGQYVAKKNAQIDALLDAICALKNIVKSKRNDYETVSSVINGALSIGDDRALEAALADGWEPDTSPETEMSDQRWYRRCRTQHAVSEETLIERYSPLSRTT